MKQFAGLFGPSTLYRRFMTPFLAVLVISVLLAWSVGYRLYSETLETRLEGQLSHAATVLADGSIPFNEPLLQRLAQLIKADVYLLDRDRRLVMASTGTILMDEGNIGMRFAIDPAVHRIVRRGRPYIQVTRRLDPSRDERFATVVLLADLSDIRAAAGRTALWLGGAATAGILLLAWVGRRSTRAIADPIRDLAEMAEAIADGDRRIRALPRGPTEIRKLAQALNGMAERLVEYENRLVERNRLAALGTMAARVAHEIRNPLTAIKMQLQLLGESLVGAPEQAVTGLIDEVRRLELIVAGVLIQGRPGPVELLPTDINCPVREIADLLRPQLAHQGIELRTLLQDGLHPVALDADRFKQVLVNLLANARDALPKGGTVEIGTSMEPGRQVAVLSVDDSGPGVPAAHRATLFRGDASNKPAGVGIGLRLCRELVEAHGGRIELANSPLGGAQFRVFIPLAPTT